MLKKPLLSSVLVAAICAPIALFYAGVFRFVTALPAAPRAAPVAAPPTVPMTAQPRVSIAAPQHQPAEPVLTSVRAPAYPAGTPELLRAVRPIQRDVDEGLASLARAGRCRWGMLFARLELETLDGEVVIRSVEVRERGDEAAMDSRPAEGGEAAECVADSFAGRKLHSPSAQKGRRWQLFYSP